MGKANYPQIKVEDYYYRKRKGLIEKSLLREVLNP